MERRNREVRITNADEHKTRRHFSFAALTITIAALVVSAVVVIHLIGAIVVIRSVRRVVGIHLIRVVIELTARMSIPGNTMSFCHINTPS